MTTMAITKNRSAGNRRKEAPRAHEHQDKEFQEVAEMEKTQDVFTHLEVEVDGFYGQPHVVIQRYLRLERGWDEQDPTVVVVIKGDYGPEEQVWMEIRASALDGLVRGLQQATTLARHYRLIPPALAPREILRLYDPEMHEAISKRRAGAGAGEQSSDNPNNPEVD